MLAQFLSSCFPVARVLLVITPFLSYQVLSDDDRSRYLDAVSAHLYASSCHRLPEGYGTGFNPSFEFPTELSSENYPWVGVSFKDEPQRYMEILKKYVLEGNLKVDWNVAENPVRSWYHAPWLHIGFRGREPIHGLTRELGSAKYYLHKKQKTKANNWAVGFYNAPGGYAVGQVWKDPSRPETENFEFPEGTVSVKLLFTDAAVDEVPYLRGSKVWFAQIHRNQEPVEMRLLQLDIAVKDSSEGNQTGWVFGTFLYQDEEPGADVYKKLVPVGLHWGNDPDRTEADFQASKPLEEGWVNPHIASLVRDLPRQWLGLWGRMNGPVDNAGSSCLACHARAMDMGEHKLSPPFAPNAKEPDAVKKYFRNRRPDEPYYEGWRSLDYSLVLSVGVDHFRDWTRTYFPQFVDDIYDVPDDEKDNRNVDQCKVIDDIWLTRQQESFSNAHYESQFSREQ